MRIERFLRLLINSSLSMEDKTKRSYTIIEPDIFEELHGDMDAIVSCLETILKKLPQLFNEFPNSIKYRVIPLRNPFGEPYPVIGMYSDNLEDLKKIPELLDLDDKVQNWINKIGLDRIIKETKTIEIGCWETLKNQNL